MKRVIIAVAAAAAAAVAITGGAIAYASIPDSSGVIHGCYTVKGGALRVIDTAKGQTCTTGQHSLTGIRRGREDQRRPAGPAGVSGYSVALCTVGQDSSGNLVVISSSGGTCSASGSPQQRHSRPLPARQEKRHSHQAEGLLLLLMSQGWTSYGPTSVRTRQDIRGDRCSAGQPRGGGESRSHMRER
jgi:hypothetical protein